MISIIDKTFKKRNRIESQTSTVYLLPNFSQNVKISYKNVKLIDHAFVKRYLAENYAFLHIVESSEFENAFHNQMQFTLINKNQHNDCLLN